MDDRKDAYEAPTMEELGTVLEMTEALITGPILDGGADPIFHHGVS